MGLVLVWDLPTRIFHWALSIGFLAAAIISLGLGDDSPLFPYHAIIGLTIASMVALRVLWGLVGTRYARFRSFAFGPREVTRYMKSAIAGGGKRYIGHNPGSAIAIFAILSLVLAMAVTGVMIGQGNEAIKETHETLAWITVGFVILHVLGVALHSVRHRENITASMIHGKKQAEPAEAITSSRPIAGAALLLITGSLAWTLLRNYDPATQTTTLPLLGTTLTLGENEQESSRWESQHEERTRHDEDDD